MVHTDQDRVYAGVAERHPGAAVIVPPRATAVPSDTAETAPTQRDGHLQRIAEHGRMGWQSASGYNKRARAEAAMNRWKQVIGDELRAHGRTTGDQGGRHRPRAQPHAGSRTPKLRPRRLSPNGAGVSAPAPLIPAPRCQRWVISCVLCNKRANSQPCRGLHAPLPERAALAPTDQGQQGQGGRVVVRCGRDGRKVRRKLAGRSWRG